MTRRLVIDTTVTRAAGTDAASDPMSICCREFLRSVLTICHKVVMSDALWDEWNRHRSKFASTWLTSMYARKKVEHVPDPDSGELTLKISKFSKSPQAQQEMLRDLHLLLAARAGDGVIVSLDREARALFREISEHVGEIGDLVWVNPCITDEAAIQWLHDGAPSQRHRELRFRDDQEP